MQSDVQSEQQTNMRYRPLRGYHLISFILLQNLDQVALTVERVIPMEHWSQLQLWHSRKESETNVAQTSTTRTHTADTSQYWIQIQPPIRLNCQQIKGQPFIAKGSHLQAAETIEPSETIAAQIATEPHLIWLEFGQLKFRKQSTLSPVDCSKLLRPVKPTVTPLWEPNGIAEKASTVKEKVYSIRNTHSMLDLEQLRTGESETFLSALRGKKDTAPTQGDAHRRKHSLWQRIGAAFGQKKNRPYKNPTVDATSMRTGGHQPSHRKSPFWLSLFSIFKQSSNNSRNVGKGKTSRGKTSKGKTDRAKSTVPASSVNPQRTLLDPIYHKLSKLWRERLMRSRLGSLIGKRQAQHFHRMMEHFNSGDLSEALKMAVPLSDYQQAVDRILSQKSLPNLGLPGTRQNLEISRRRYQGRRGSYNVGQASYTQLRAMYEKAYQQLKKAEKHKEAAFVLAELLNRIDEAVDYLAEHGFLAEAAEISEHRSSQIEKTIKLWIQAGDVERAIALAIRSNSFKAALFLLKGNKQALPLESEWINRLIQNGDFETLFAYYVDNNYSHATQILKIQRLTTFFEDILPADYLKEPAWLARYMCTQPWNRIETEFMHLLQTPWSKDFAKFWTAFFSLINKHTVWKNILKSQASQPLLREWYRQATTYYGQPSAIASKRQINFLSVYITDRLFLNCRPKTFDNPFVPLPATTAQPTNTFQFCQSENLITDVAITADGKVCVALGSIGLQAYDSKGRYLKQSSVPAHKLVSPITGNTVITIEHREKLHRIHRIQFHTHKVDFIGQQPIDIYGRHHNGSTWPVYIGDRVSLVDVLADEWSSLWKTGHLEGNVRQIVSNAKQLTFLLEDKEQIHPWKYRLPQLRLTSRDSLHNIHQTPKDIERLSLGNSGEIVGICLMKDANNQTAGIEFYRSSNLKKYTKIGQIEQNNQYAQPLTAETVRVIHSDASFLVTTIAQSSQEQLIQAFQIKAGKLEHLFSIESSSQPIVVQVNSFWIAIGQGDQLLIYDNSSKDSCLIKVN